MRTLFALASATLVTATSFAQTTIDQVAPENTVLVFGIDDYTATVERLQSHPAFADLGAPDDMLDDPDLLELLPEEAREIVDAGGKAIPNPQGPLGAALFVVTDPETGIPGPGILLYGDFGEDAPKLLDYLKGAAGKAAEAGAAHVTTREIAGHNVTTVRLAEDAQGEDDFDFDDMNMGDQGEDPFAAMMPGPGDLLDKFEQIHIVQSGRAVMVGTDLPSVANALSALGGKPKRTLAGNRVYNEIRAQLGHGEAYAVLLSKDLAQLVAGADPMGIAMMMTPTLRAAFGEIKGWGYTLQTDDGPAPIRHRIAALMPYGKEGLPGLIDVPGPRSAPPAFVGNDVLSYAAYNVDLDGVVAVVQQVLQSNPMFQMQFAGQWEMYRPLVRDVCGALGSTVHMVSTSPSESGLFAIDCKDPEKIRTMLDNTAEEMGIVGRDVGGHRIWTLGGGQMPMQGMAPGMGEMEGAIALSGNYLFLGDAGSVDDVLMGGDREPLANDAAFLRAMETIGSESVVGWGYVDFTKAAAGLGDMGDNAADMGVTVWWLESTKSGFVGTAQQLLPVQAVNVITDQP